MSTEFESKTQLTASSGWPDRLLRTTVTIVSASFWGLYAPPTNWYWLQWFGLVPFFWVLRADTPRENLSYSMVYGTVAVASIFYWIADTIALFSNIPFVGAVGVLLLFSFVFGLPFVALWATVHPLRRRFGPLWILLLAAVQVLLEFAERYVFLFPYNGGAAQYQFTMMWQIVSVTGVWGASWAVFAANATLAEVFYARRDGAALPARSLIAGWLLFLANLGFGAWRTSSVEHTLSTSKTLRVAQLQSDKGMQERLATSARVTFDGWLQQTKEIKPGTADLVVWPEGASPYSLQQDKVAAVFGELARQGKFEMVVGGGARERNPNTGAKTGMIAFNSVYYVDRAGKIDGRYDKMVPLPFGEYMPFRGTPLSFLLDWVEGVGDFRAGTEAVVLGREVRYATPICYEATLGNVCRLFSKPDLLVTVTNDAWFGRTGQPYQHEMMAAVRATELGIPMFRAAYTGVSAIIEPHGKIRERTLPFEKVSRVVSVRLGNVPTLYAQWGDWFVLANAVFLTAALAAHRRKSRMKHPAPATGGPP